MKQNALSHVPCTPVCAIGASAGGVPALQELFRLLPENLGLAYVVILHVSPDHPSSLQEILGTSTRMPVFQVHDSPLLKPNSVYVIAPDSELVINGDSVSARPFSEPRGQRAPIDMFFRSVAAGHGDGIAMVLTGSGSDGAQGVRFIKEAGGVVLVQDPAEAEFPSMPQCAIATEMTDFVGPIARLVERLSEVARTKEALRSLDLDGAADDLRRIVAFLRNQTGHDFSSYKRATILRRVTRRMQVCRLDSMAAYAELLQATPDEAKKLFADLLISVTAFFRDPSAFEVLKRQAIGPLLDAQQQSHDEVGIRAWVVGCATGEEAYSLAILFLETMRERNQHWPIQIFATDLDEAALATAREGRYPKSIEATMSEARLSRYFVDEGANYRVRTEVRETVVFAMHSVIKDPPFLRLDLISCRNLLIYMERNLQQQLYAVFHYGLKKRRFLFLGSAETVDTKDLFTPVEREARLYTAQSLALQSLPILPQFPIPDRVVAQRSSAQTKPALAQLATALHSAALEAGAPSVLVDANHAILNLSSTAGRFLLHIAGPPSILLPAVVRPELRLDLQLALTRALNQQLPTLTPPTNVSLDGERRRVAMYIVPLAYPFSEVGRALVYFLDGGAESVSEIGATTTKFRPEEMLWLHTELRQSQEALVASRSNHDATIQDLRTVNEEFQSTNEEFRSTAEELETSREELQSINEELHTVNAELRRKLDHLSTAHSNLQNLTMLTEVGTLFLDNELRIKMFTPPVVDVFNITPFDIGRVLTDFTHRLSYPALLDDARGVVHSLAPIEREVQGSNGRVYVLRMRPYRTVEDRIEGVVLTFVDITARLSMEAALSRSEQQFRALVRASSQVLYRMSPDWTEMRELFGGGFLSNMQGPTQGWLDHYVPANDRERVQAVIQQAIDTKGIFDLQHRVLRDDGTVGWTHSRAIPILDVNNDITEWFGSADDVTQQHRAQSALRESEERLRVLVEGVPQQVWRAERSGLWTWSSPQWHAYTGLSEAESRGSGWLAAVHPDDRRALLTACYTASNTQTLELECRIRNVERTEYRWFHGRATPLLDPQGIVVEWLGTFTDVNDMRALQGRQEVLLAELQHRVRNIMAVIRTIAARTAENSPTVGDYAARLKGRLEALSRTQVMLTRQAGVGVDLRTMVQDELLTQTSQAGQVDIDGPPVILSAKAAEVLTLAVHELATNAVKYGALSVKDATVQVRWHLEQQKEELVLTLHWTESGITTNIAEPRRKGFGTDLIEGRVPYELNGTGRLQILADGVQAVISFPLRPGKSILQTDANLARLPQHGGL